MAERGQDTTGQIGGFDAQRGRVAAGVAAEIFVRERIAVDHQTDVLFRIVEQPEHGHRAGRYAQEFLHAFRVCERQARAAQLRGQLLGAELLAAGHEQQGKLRFLPVAKEQVFADFNAEQLFDFAAGLDRGCFVVVDALRR